MRRCVVEKRSHHQTSTCRQVGAVNAVLKGPIHAANAFALPSPASGIHPIPESMFRAASKTLGPVRIHYDITLDSITQDSTQLRIVPAATQRFGGKWAKSS
jgi:hypothetical protein